MPGCVLRVSGPYAELSRSLAHAFVPLAESRLSVLSRERGESDEATFVYTVSEADGNHVPQQIQEAEAFVSENAEALESLWSMPGVSRAMLDFGWEIPRGAYAQWNRFPAKLLLLCASAGLDIEISVYLFEARES